MTAGIILMIISIAGASALWFSKNYQIRVGKDSFLAKFSQYGDPRIRFLLEAVKNFYGLFHRWRFEGAVKFKASVKVLCVKGLVGAKSFFDRQFFFFMNLIRGRKLLSGRNVRSGFLKDILDYKHRLTKER